VRTLSNSLETSRILSELTIKAPRDVGEDQGGSESAANGLNRGYDKIMLRYTSLGSVSFTFVRLGLQF
jgi:hypothetical protein